MSKKEFTPYVSGNLIFYLSYAALFGFWGLSNVVLIPVPVNLIATSTLIILIGCHRSLALLETGDDGKVVIERETISKEDAYKFPIMGSLALGSLYIAFKYFDKVWVNFLLSLYFSLVGTLTLTATTSPMLASLGFFGDGKKKFGPKFKLPVLGDVDLQLSVPELIALVPSIVFSYFYFKTKHYLLNNVLGISFCVQTIERVSLGSYKIGAILLVGLFFYDIFWVFGTDVMVTVAKSFDGPIKLLFPRSFEHFVLENGVEVLKKAEFSLLGLGDIVIPGLFVAILIRFDAVRARVNPKGAEGVAFPKPFFYTNIVSYALGLLATVFVMYYFNAAQPALLYLVPACLGGSLITALTQGNLSELFAYDEDTKTQAENTSVEAKKEK